MIYEVTCTCKESYIGKTRRNVEINWKEHEDTHKDSKPANYLRNYSGHSFTWKFLFSSSTNDRLRKNIEVSIIALK